MVRMRLLRLRRPSPNSSTVFGCGLFASSGPNSKHLRETTYDFLTRNGSRDLTLREKTLRGSVEIDGRAQRAPHATTAVRSAPMPTTSNRSE